VIEVLRLLVLVWLTLVAVVALRHLLSGRRQAVFVVLIAHWAFNATPLLWDLIFGMPAYARYPNFARSAVDPTTNLIHLLYTAGIPVLLWVFGLPWRRRPPQHSDPLASPASEPGVPIPALYALMVLPLLLALMSPLPTLYLRYGFVTDDSLQLPAGAVFFHAFVAMTAILSVTAATTLLRSRETLLKQWMVTFPWVVIAIYLMGKRTIIALYFVLLAQRLWDLGVLKGARIPLYLTVFLVFFAGMLFGYQMLVRNIKPSTVPPEIYYEDMRIDYGRDHTVRAAIYAELQGQRITTYRAQSVVFNLSAIIPRTWWPQKPYPYGLYMTSYAHDIPSQDLGWTFTTCIFDESISNFSWFGMFAGCLFLGLLCRLADDNRTILFRSLGYIVCVLFLAVQLNAFLILFVTWLSGTMWHQYRHVISLRPGRFFASGG
jgi:hypothetical protein